MQNLCLILIVKNQTDQFYKIPIKVHQLLCFPVTKVIFFSTPSFNKFLCDSLVGQKCKFAIDPVSFLLASSGQGEYIFPVLKPASHVQPEPYCNKHDKLVEKVVVVSP